MSGTGGIAPPGGGLPGRVDKGTKRENRAQTSSKRRQAGGTTPGPRELPRGRKRPRGNQSPAAPGRGDRLGRPPLCRAAFRSFGRVGRFGADGLCPAWGRTAAAAANASTHRKGDGSLPRRSRPPHEGRAMGRPGSAPRQACPRVGGVESRRKRPRRTPSGVRQGIGGEGAGAKSSGTDRLTAGGQVCCRWGRGRMDRLPLKRPPPAGRSRRREGQEWTDTRPDFGILRRNEARSGRDGRSDPSGPRPRVMSLPCRRPTAGEEALPAAFREEGFLYYAEPGSRWISAHKHKRVPDR